MKRKFLSVAICLMLCLSSMFMFTACKEKPTKISRDEAVAAFDSAMETMAEAEGIKITANVMGISQMVCIGTEAGSYINLHAEESFVEGGNVETFVIDIENWITEEEGVWVNYSLLTMAENGGEPVVETSDKTVLQDMQSMFENEQLKGFDLLNFDNYVQASTLKGEISIVFASEGFSATAKIVNGTLVAVDMSQYGLTATFYFTYGDFSEEIPSIPQDGDNLTWDLLSEIVVEGIPDVLKYGEPLDINTLTLKFYQEGIDGFVEPVVVELTQDMISQTENGYVVTYLGLTFEIPYTIPAA